MIFTHLANLKTTNLVLKGNKSKSNEAPLSHAKVMHFIENLFGLG